MNKILNFYQFVNEASGKTHTVEYIMNKAGTELEKISLKLTGSSSGEVTKLLNKFVETYELLKKAQESHEEIKELLKDKVNKEFEEAVDNEKVKAGEAKFYSRLITTVSYGFTFSKYTKEKATEVEEVDYQKAFDEMMEIFPEIKEGLKEIIKNNTQIKTVIKKEIAGSIKYTHINVNEGLIEFMRGFINKFKTIFTPFGRSLKKKITAIDKKLLKIESIIRG